ncbi:MAG: AAA family ATPase, partial [Peptococcaceae bacterium]|nr:AAA family ATPase [Peptococcaceae bacterium]
MYKAFYGLTGNPFAKDLAVQDLFVSQDYKQFAARMEYFKTVKGLAVAYGRPGMGKTTCIRAYTARLNPQLFKVVYLTLSVVTVMEFYRNLCFGLGLVPRFKKVDMFHEIQNHLVTIHHQKNQTPFLIFDECQFLGSAILNELRMLFNFQMDSQNHAMVLLCGQPSFINQLNLHIHEPLRQRIVTHHQFKGLQPQEVGDFLTTLLAKFGFTEPLFTPDAIKAMTNAAQGNIRTLCSLAEKSLLIGAQRGLRSLDAN